MSDEVFSVVAPFPDVASLAEGYLDRADGERLLLPLPKAQPEGSGLRFVVHLSDGTPAFAGAGLCVQSTDQGKRVPAAQRFETLIDSLRFDARSRPVYDYIVAVRAAAYAQGAGAEAALVRTEDAADGEVLADEVDVDSTAVLDLFAQHRRETERPMEEDRITPVPGEIAPVKAETTPPRAERESAHDREVTPWPDAMADSLPVAVAREPSFIPPQIPTGLLTRRARTMHWQPAPPRRPTPRPASGLFRYGPAGLPRPSRPPRPEIDPAHCVTPAPRP